MDSNHIKKAPLLPAANFHDVVSTEVSKNKFNKVILQASPVDITNLKTNNITHENIEFFRQEVKDSAKSLFSSAELALNAQPSIEKVVIMNQIPRYDPPSEDPQAMKSSLSLLFNSTLTEQWMTSEHKNKIFIGNHNLDCVGASREARFREAGTGRYDGIHMKGPSGRKFYTNSVLGILQASNTISLSDFNRNKVGRATTFLQNDVHNSPKNQQKVVPLELSNRFTPLSGLSEGNC